MTINAVKPVWNGKEFKVEIHRDIHSLGIAAQEGFLVYDDPKRTLADLKSKKLLPKWSDRKRHVVIDFLEAEVGNEAAGLFTWKCGCLSPVAGGEVTVPCEECK